MKAKKPMRRCWDCKCVTLQARKCADELCNCGESWGQDTITVTFAIDPQWMGYVLDGDRETEVTNITIPTGTTVQVQRGQDTSIQFDDPEGNHTEYFPASDDADFVWVFIGETEVTDTPVTLEANTTLTVKFEQRTWTLNFDYTSVFNANQGMEASIQFWTYSPASVEVPEGARFYVEEKYTWTEWDEPGVWDTDSTYLKFLDNDNNVIETIELIPLPIDKEWVDFYPEFDASDFANDTWEMVEVWWEEFNVRELNDDGLTADIRFVWACDNDFDNIAYFDSSEWVISLFTDDPTSENRVDWTYDEAEGAATAVPHWFFASDFFNITVEGVQDPVNIREYIFSSEYLWGEFADTMRDEISAQAVSTTWNFDGNIFGGIDYVFITPTQEQAEIVIENIMDVTWYDMPIIIWADQWR